MLLGQPPALVEPHLAEVDSNDRPAMLGEPYGVAPLAGAQIDGGARREAAQLTFDEAMDSLV